MNYFSISRDLEVIFESECRKVVDDDPDDHDVKSKGGRDNVEKAILGEST